MGSLGQFYLADNSFSEGFEYLKSVGAIDETSKKMPMVIITNYMYAPSNCIGTSKYHTHCCLNECEVLMSELEGIVRSPTASPGWLLSVVANNLSSSSVDVPRRLSHMLVEKMGVISSFHRGFVPIHGRLFQQWLHYAFPREC